MRLILILVGALWGASSGLLLPRAAHRLSVDPEEPWNGECPDGHPITGPFDGWLGRASCTNATTIDTTSGAYGNRPPAPASSTCRDRNRGNPSRPGFIVWTAMTFKSRSR
ncbi:hypothetical protein [Streptomyces sp. Agncl-13]|uniref:hypothetical protein n=1 Tax=Streptomyces sp. Agncl-13 TaxID=3400628 RepID=UPI003A837483